MFSFKTVKPEIHFRVYKKWVTFVSVKQFIMPNRKPIQLAYNVYEPRQSTEDHVPLIFLHGITTSKENWGHIPQFIANAMGKKAYNLDARNHGDSEWSDVFDFQINVDDLLLFMDNLNIPKAILIGHSMGGVTAMKTALLAPERVDKVIVEDMTTKSCPQKILEPTLVYLNLAKEAVKKIPPGTRIDFAKKFIADYTLDNMPEKMKLFTKYESNDSRLILRKNPDETYEFKCNLELLLEVIKDAKSFLTDFEGVYDGPICFIYGERSPFQVGQDEDLLKAYFPNLQMVGIKNALHSVHLDFTLPFVEAVLDFLLARK